MNGLTKIVIGSVALVSLSLSALVVKAGDWDNFKLRYFYLTKHFNDQGQELADLRKRNVELSQSSRINLTELLAGGPPKDGIPSIDNPKFDSAANTPFKSKDWVIGIVINGEAKAYAFKVMNWHEIVNDRIGGVNVSVSYCPLCDTIVAMNRGNTTFGVSGKLYQSCLVMYDRADDTLYVQPWALGVVGPNVNRSLSRVPAVKTTLGAWLKKYPNSLVLSTATGHQRDYTHYPYGTYYTDNQLVFPVRNQQKRTLPPKAIVSYIWEPDQQIPRNRFSGESFQFVHKELQQIGSQVVKFQGQQIRARWDKDLETVIVEELDGQPIPSTIAFAFVYPAFFSSMKDRIGASNPISEDKRHVNR